MQWLLVMVMGFFAFGVGRAIKLYYINRDPVEYMQNAKLALLGVAATFVVGGLLISYAGVPAPDNSGMTWLVIGGPFVLAFFGDKELLRGR